MSVVFVFNASLNDVAPVLPNLLTVDQNDCFDGFLFVCLSFLSLHLSSSSVSVLFDFSASLNEVAPLSPISLSVDIPRKKKMRIVDGCLLCVFFLLSSLSKLSFMSVVFDFNASLNDVAPVSSILLSVDLFFQTRHKNNLEN